MKAFSRFLLLLCFSNCGFVAAGDFDPFSSVNPVRVCLTFNAGSLVAVQSDLRRFLRQFPDVILVSTNEDIRVRVHCREVQQLSTGKPVALTLLSIVATFPADGAVSTNFLANPILSGITNLPSAEIPEHFVYQNCGFLPHADFSSRCQDIVRELDVGAIEVCRSDRLALSEAVRRFKEVLGP